jgi:amidohydrolase
MKTTIDEAKTLSDRIVEVRRHIHRHPETAFREQATAEYITRILRAEGIECRPIARTGVLARIEGTGDLKSAVVLRADIDALPVSEATGLEFASQNEGVMHACGHDMHAAALVGALTMLARRRDEIRGTVFGLFQPGEELAPGGASMVLAEEPFADYKVRAFVGQHVDPELHTGIFGIRAGQYMASTDELHIAVRGEGGHGALRATLKDPVQAAATLIVRLLELGNTPDSVLSIGRVAADGATNVIPDLVEMKGTLRTFDEGLRAELTGAIAAAGTAVAARFGVEVDAGVRTGFPSVVNDAALAARAADILRDGFGADAVVALERRMTGEDFGFYTRRYPSLFYRFGVGRGPHTGKLHSPHFNPDEGALSYGAAGLVALALNL